MEQIVIKRPRMIIVLREDEVLSMLNQFPDIWLEGLKRGKHFSRAEKSYERKAKPIKNTFHKL